MARFFCGDLLRRVHTAMLLINLSAVKLRKSALEFGYVILYSYKTLNDA